MKWQPSTNLETLKIRNRVLQSIRSFFQARNVLEVETPILSTSTTPDPFIDSFCLLTQQHKLYLHTSPEFYMKRLLAADSGDIFQICKVFRNDESGRHHHREFTLLEWYRLDYDEISLMSEVENLILNLWQQINKAELTVEYVSYKECFIQHCGINPHHTFLEELIQVAAQNHLENVLSEEDDMDRWLEMLMSCVIDRHLGGTKDQPKLTFVFDYPASQAALARKGKNKQGELVAKRFEAYLGGIELANGFYELIDAQEQQQRFDEENSYRSKMSQEQMPVDSNFMKALKHGLPECAGVALGLDRLLMTMTKQENISQVISFFE